MLTIVTSLLRLIVIKFYKGYMECANIFMLCLGPSGVGKLNAFKKACVHPVYHHVEKHNGDEDLTIILDEFTQSGIFHTICDAKESHVPLIAIDECYNFFQNAVKCRGSYCNMQRLCRLYDGCLWASSKNK